MKQLLKAISLLLVFSMLLAVFASCGDDSDTTETPDTTNASSCSAEWCYTTAEHWQACDISGCDKHGAKAPHAFGEGVTAVDGTQVTYTEACAVCGYQKIEKGATDLKLTFDGMVDAIYDGALTLVLHDTAKTENGLHYFQGLSHAPDNALNDVNTLKVKAFAPTSATLVITSLSTGSKGTYSTIYSDLQVNGSSEGVTYTAGSPSFAGWDSPKELTVATLTLQEGINEISFKMLSDVNIAAIKLVGLQSAVIVAVDENSSSIPKAMLSGQGTEASPWLIASADDFVTMNEWIKYDASYATGYYKMTADIDLAGSDFAGITSMVEFSGVFDGNGHVIENLKIDRELRNNVGLFGKVVNGTVKNLGIASGSVVGNFYVGGFVGYAQNITLLNCFNEADVRANREVGGLVGTVVNAKFYNSFNAGAIRLSGSESIGGLVGRAQNVQFDNCYNIGTVGYGTYSGQLVGWANTAVKFTNTYYDKTAAPKEQPVGTRQSFTGVTGKTREELIAATFVETLNQNAKDGYMTWVFGEDKIARLSTFIENNKIAIFMASIESVSIKDKKVVLPTSADGAYKAALYGSDKQSVIALDGKVYEPLTDQKVLLILDIVKVDTGEVVDQLDRNIEVTVSGRYSTSGTNAVPNVVPGLREWYGLSGDFKVTANTRIVAASAEMKTLATRIQTYMQDMLGMTLTVADGEGQNGDIVLKYNPSLLGELGDEGNAITVDDKIVIEAATETGVFYGAVSIMQILYQDSAHTNIPKGYIRDYPAYEMRGGMIDVARKYFSIDYIEEIGKYMSWFKLNTLNLHLNDNGGERTASFVVESKKYPEINSFNGENIWTQDEYRQLQKTLKTFGVNVISEIDTPGHSKVFAQADSSLVSGNSLLLNTKYDEALAFVKGIYDEFLDGDDPVFQSAVVHIGTDEANNASNEDMRRYISDLSQYVLAKDNVDKVIFWGNLTYYYGNTDIDPENVITQIWDSADYRADEALSHGFEVLNSTSDVFYLVPRFSAEFGDMGQFNGYVDIARFYDIWEGASDFTTHNLRNPDSRWKGYYYAEHNFLKGNPKILGAIFCNWNDIGIGFDYDLLTLIVSYIGGVAEKCWYGDADRFETGEEFKAAFNQVGDFAPYANPRYRVKSEGVIIASYDFEETVNGAVKDTANGYHATVSNGSIQTVNGSKVLALNGSTSLKMPFKGVGYPYTATFRIYLDGAQKSDAILFTCDECTIYLDYNGKGVAFESGNYVYAFGVQIPQNEWVDIMMTSQMPKQVDAQSNISVLSVNGVEYLPSNITNTRSQSRTTILGTEKAFLGVKGYVDDVVICNEFRFDPEFVTFRFEGEGTAASPYLISSANDLRMFSALVNRGEYTLAYFKLTADIDMTGVSYASVAEFGGTLDGDGHTITGLTINEAEQQCVGLIGYLNGGTVKNLGIEKSTVSGKKWVGAIVGKTMNAVIVNCYSAATVTGTDDVGGLVGMFNSSKMQNCYSLATVTGTTSVGGLVGSVNTSLNKNNPAAFDNVYAAATVSGTKYVGIIAGYDESAKYTITLENVYYSGTLPLSGYNTISAGTKLTEAQMTDGTLLAYLNQNVKTGYTAWTANGAGYPVFG